MKTISVVIPENLLEIAKISAKENGRKLSQEIRHVLEKAYSSKDSDLEKSA